MANQQLIFAETIAGMKRALKKNPYESDSDEEIQGTSNRGNKLQKRSRYVHQGQINTPSGPSVYKEVVEHAGYQRTIIHRNPLPVDEDGFTLDSDDDDEYIQQVTATAAEDNPYASIRLEHILAPLTSVSDLPNHPTMSRAYTSRTLTDLSLQGRDVMHKENQSLWKVKHLLTQLCGDHYWAPTGLMEGSSDIEFFTKLIMGPSSINDVQGEAAQGNNHQVASDKLRNHVSIKETAQDLTSEPGQDTEIADITPSTGVGNLTKTRNQKSSSETEEIVEKRVRKKGDDTKFVSKPNGKGKEVKLPDAMVLDTPRMAADAIGSILNTNGSSPNGLTGGENSGEQQLLELDSDEPFIHPIFLQSESSKPDRDFFLPQDEAAELRRLLQLYVQRQEEICRGSRRMYEGLLKADRLRKMVFFWSKAEAHTGANCDLSDGEDWYDKEEWGLDEPLKKGHDDEEEEAQQNQKKTRNRR